MFYKLVCVSITFITLRGDIADNTQSPEIYIAFCFSGPSYPSFDPMLDGRKEIAKYNQFMDEIFTRMNIAIKAKNLDPMDLKLLPNADKMPRLQTTFVTNVSGLLMFLMRQKSSQI